MAGRITALKVQKRNRNRVSIYLDGSYAFGVPDIVAVSLRVGQFLSDVEREALEEKASAEVAHSLALNYLSYRPRSSAEMTTYLARRGFSERRIEEVIRRLETAGLLDDVAFAQFWVENRERFRPRGLWALRHELRSKGVADDTIEGALNSLDVSDSAYRAASRKARQLQSLDHQTFKRKLVEYLSRRGFRYNVAQDAAERHWIELTVDGG